MPRFLTLLVLTTALCGVRSASAQAPPSPPPLPVVTSPTNGPSSLYLGTWFSPDTIVGGTTLTPSGTAGGSSYGVQWTYGSVTGPLNSVNVYTGGFTLTGYIVPDPAPGTKQLVTLNIRSIDSQGRYSAWVEINVWATSSTP
jgi:hypothetical protein